MIPGLSFHSPAGPGPLLAFLRSPFRRQRGLSEAARRASAFCTRKAVNVCYLSQIGERFCAKLDRHIEMRYHG